MLRFIIFIGLLVTGDIDGTFHPHVPIPASFVASNFPGLSPTTSTSKESSSSEKTLTAAQLPAASNPTPAAQPPAAVQFPSASIPTPEEVPDEVPTIDDSGVSADGALPAPGGPLPPIYPPQDDLGYNCHQAKLDYHAYYNGKKYWFSWMELDDFGQHPRLTWSEARDRCRSLCMDLVSLETPQEQAFIRHFVQAAQITGAWTSGRLCQTTNCAADTRIQPLRQKGWFWAATGANMGDTLRTGGWSSTGPSYSRQADNHHQVISSRAGGYSNNGDSSNRDGSSNRGGQTFPSEDCVAVLNNVFMDGVRWHDLLCTERLAYVCEETPATMNRRRPAPFQPAGYNY